jgi:hypothetical protein
LVKESNAQPPPQLRGRPLKPKPTETEIIDIHPLKHLASPFYFEMSKKFNTILSEINEENKTASVIIPSDTMSLAIGKGGLNIKLASKLTGYKINVFSDVDHNEDVLLEDFSDEIDGWIIDEFKKVGYDTAKSVLKADFNLLVKQTDLEEETIREVVKILKSEFE